MERPPRLFSDPEGTPDSADSVDGELDQVADQLLRADPDGVRAGDAIRETFDQLLDGQRTGRWDYRQLRKTEKTHMGTLVEINLHRAFQFEDGLVMDYRIAGAEVDCKFSQSRRGWQIPLEADGYLCLLVWADDDLSRWSGGLVRISEDILRPGGNRDRKRTLNGEGLRRMRRLWHELPLPENLLLHLDARTQERIFSFTGRRNGQRRTDELFRLVQGRLVSRTAVLTVAQQDDPPKRVRDARIHLRKEGIVILGHQGDHPRVARELALPIPAKGQWVSARLSSRASSRDVPFVGIGGVAYRLALADDRPQLAPVIDALREEA